MDHLQVGQVICDFLPRQAFLDFCKKWLDSNHFHHVVTLNPEMVVQAEINKEFRDAVKKATLRIPDGAGLVWAQWYIRSDFWSLWSSLLAFSFRHVERIPGVEVVYMLAGLCAEKNLPLYLLGGTANQVNGTAQKLRRRFQRLNVFVSDSDVEDIKKKQPAVLLVAYGAPKQTIWIEEHRENFPSVRIAVGVGGAFAILSEERSRAPSFLRRLNLEWLWRLILEPSRLPRIWRAVMEFPRLVAKQKRGELYTLT